MAEIEDNNTEQEESTMGQPDSGDVHSSFRTEPEQAQAEKEGAATDAEREEIGLVPEGEEREPDWKPIGTEVEPSAETGEPEEQGESYWGEDGPGSDQVSDRDRVLRNDDQANPSY